MGRLKQWLGWKPSAPQPMELKRGGLYVIEATEPMDGDSFQELQNYLKTVTEKTGCEFVVLDHGFQIALAEERP